MCNEKQIQEAIIFRGLEAAKLPQAVKNKLISSYVWSILAIWILPERLKSFR